MSEPCFCVAASGEGMEWVVYAGPFDFEQAAEIARECMAADESPEPLCYYPRPLMPEDLERQQRRADRRGIEDDYQRHRAREYWPEEAHPDGCWYCGSYSHPTDCCTDDAARSEAWDY